MSETPNCHTMPEFHEECDDKACQCDCHKPDTEGLSAADRIRVAIAYQEGKAEYGMIVVSVEDVQAILDQAEAPGARLQCGICGRWTLTRNPHPDAGKPSTLLTVGAMYECIPCNRKAAHTYAERWHAARRQVEELTKRRAKIQDDILEAAALKFESRRSGPEQSSHSYPWIARELRAMKSVQS